MQDNRFSFDKECVLLVCSLIGCVFGGGGGRREGVSSRHRSCQYSEILAFIETKGSTFVAA